MNSPHWKQKLQSTVMSAAPMAIINGRVPVAEDRISGSQIVQITARSCIAVKDGVRVTLQMDSQHQVCSAA